MAISFLKQDSFRASKPLHFHFCFLPFFSSPCLPDPTPFPFSRWAPKDSPASTGAWTDKSAAAPHARFGGSGYCPQTAFEPADGQSDGQWPDGKPFDITVKCGATDDMFRQVLADQKQVTAAIALDGVFSSSTIKAAFRAANPDLVYTPHAFFDVTRVETVENAFAATEMGPITRTGRMRLLTPRQFLAQSKVKGTSEKGRCNWCTQHIVTWDRE